MRIVVVVALLLAGPPLAYALAWAALALDRHDLHEMDWDGSGRVTLPEIVAGTDVGRRVVLIRGRECTEFFAFKDGLPIGTACPGRLYQSAPQAFAMT